jgi:hypothetical protein
MRGCAATLRARSVRDGAKKIGSVPSQVRPPALHRAPAKHVRRFAAGRCPSLAQQKDMPRLASSAIALEHDLRLFASSACRRARAPEADMRRLAPSSRARALDRGPERGGRQERPPMRTFHDKTSQDMRRLAALVGLLVLAACPKPAARAVDAGTLEKHPSDLRTILFTIYPEPRGNLVTGGSATITRHYAATGDWLASVQAIWNANHLELQDGGLAARGPLYSAEVRPEGAGAVGIVTMPMGPAEVDRVYASPLGYTTEQLGAALPSDSPQLTVLSEDFTLGLAYRSKAVPVRVRQMVRLVLSAGWTVDALPPDWDGEGPLRESFTMNLMDPAGPKLTVTRSMDQIDLFYTLATQRRR